jgi:hypothetical protein
MTPLDPFAIYRLIGWGPHLIPIPAGRKGPVIKDWPTRAFDPDDFPPGGNVGLHLIPVVDIDIDCAEALVLQDIYLPPTGAIFGRPSKLRSHRLFIAPGSIFETFHDPLASKDQKSTLLELRTGSGKQTVIPPSIADGEQRAWRGDTIAPAGVSAKGLRIAVAWLAVGCLVRRYVSARASETPGPDMPRLLWEFDHTLGRAAYRWWRQPAPDEPHHGWTPKSRCELTADEIDLAELVAAIPNNEDWEGWNNIGLAIFAASDGSNHGGIVFDDWSAKSPKYNPYVTADRWSHYHRSPPDRTGIGKLIKLGLQNGWRPKREATR